MAKQCEICGKGGMAGSIIVRHGLAKKKGGIGLHITGISKRRFQVNLHTVRVRENGRVLRRRVCAACIKSDRIQKA